MISEIDRDYMKMAIQEARKGAFSTSPNPVVGCVVVKNSRVIGKGFHYRAGEGHAEVNAILNLSESAIGSTVYVTLEPCSYFGKTPPCCNMLVKEGINKVVIGMLDPNPLVSGRGAQFLKESGLEVVIEDDILIKNELHKLNKGFLKKMTTGYPLIFAKLATSLDGAISLKTGESKWLTSQTTRNHAMSLRARSCAIITGKGTIINDDPTLNVRSNCRKYELIQQPDIIIFDTQLTIPPSSKVFDCDIDRKVYLICSDKVSARKKNMYISNKVKVIGLKNSDGSICLNEFMGWLKDRSFNTIMIESGAKLITSFIESGNLDEIYIYKAPVLLGPESISFYSHPITSLTLAKRFRLIEVKAIENDVMSHYVIPTTSESLGGIL